MARETYREVTPETKRAVEDHVKGVADEWRKSTTYVYAILAGESSDPFAKFASLFRAVSRKNPPGALGYINRLHELYESENPSDGLSAALYEIEREWENVKALMRKRERGMCAPEEVQAAKYRFIERFARLGLPENMGSPVAP